MSENSQNALDRFDGFLRKYRNAGYEPPNEAQRAVLVKKLDEHSKEFPEAPGLDVLHDVGEALGWHPGTRNRSLGEDPDYQILFFNYDPSSLGD